jgi:hypothetical protein
MGRITERTNAAKIRQDIKAKVYTSGGRKTKRLKKIHALNHNSALFSKLSRLEFVLMD